MSCSRQATARFVFSYTYANHLVIAGGNFTTGGPVQVVVRFNNGPVKFSKRVYAKAHPVTPGGAVYVTTQLRSVLAHYAERIRACL